MDSLFRLPKPIPHAAVAHDVSRDKGTELNKLLVKPKTDGKRMLWLCKGVRQLVASIPGRGGIVG